MIKMHRIEKLIENEVYKSPLPEFLGQGPEWKLRSSTPREHIRKKGGFNNRKKQTEGKMQGKSQQKTNKSVQSTSSGKKTLNRKPKQDNIS